MFEANFEIKPRSLTMDAEIAEREEIQAVFEINPVTGDKSYVFTQGTPSTTWNIEHNLEKFPSVTLINNDGEQIFTRIVYESTSKCVAYFSENVSGKAYLN